MHFELPLAADTFRIQGSHFFSPAPLWVGMPVAPSLEFKGRQMAGELQLSLVQSAAPRDHTWADKSCSSKSAGATSGQ